MKIKMLKDTKVSTTGQDYNEWKKGSIQDVNEALANKLTTNGYAELVNENPKKDYNKKIKAFNPIQENKKWQAPLNL